MKSWSAGSSDAEAITIIDQVAIIDAVRRWTSAIVIGLDLCPFARRVFQGDLIRYIVSEASDPELLRSQLADELKTLGTTPIESVETTLLIHPCVLERFDEYLEFLADAERLVKSIGYRGVIQIAGFHPEYQFANTEPDAVENYTNRSPYPMLHLLREESVTKVAADPEELLQIPKRNISVLRQIGRDKMLDLLKALGANGDVRPRQ
jgi:hypothetical protein